MKKLIAIFVSLMLLVGCSNNGEKSTNNVNNIEEEKQNEVVQNSEDTVPLTDGGDIIFLPNSNLDIIETVYNTFGIEMGTYNGGDKWFDYEGFSDDNELFLEVSTSPKFGISWINALCKENNENIDLFFMSVVVLANHDGFDGQSASDWVVSHKYDESAKEKFAEANIEISKGNNDYIILTIYTDGNDWWQNKLLDEMVG